MRRKNSGILLVFVFVMLIGIGYAFLNTKLTINGTSNFSANSWLIYFDEIRANANNTAEATEPAVITDAAKTNISFDVNLEDPGDFYEFDVYIKNDGTIDAMIDEVIMPELTEEEKKYMTFSYTYVDGTKIRKCDKLNSHGYRDTRLRVEYLESGELDLVPEGKTRHFDVTITYVQTSECDVDEVDLDIDPAGGIYNGTDSITNVALKTGETYDLLTPTREGYNFVEWLDENDTGAYENGTVTFNGTNVKLKAKWELSNDVVAKIDREEPVYYMSIQKAINDANSNETIKLLKDTSEEFTNNKNVTIDLQGYKVTGSGSNILGARLTLVNGSIENTNGVGFVNHGVLTLGIDDENLCDVANNTCAYENGFVGITGTTKGLEQDGILNFYDGFIEGNIAIDGGANKTPVIEELGDGTQRCYDVLVNYDDVQNNQKAYLVEEPIDAVSKTIVGGNIYYTNLSTNFDVSAVNGYKIYAVKDFTGDYELNVPANSNIEFDVTGYDVTILQDINMNGTLTLEDSAVEKGSLKISKSIKTNGALNLNDISILTPTKDDEAYLEYTNAIVTTGDTIINSVKGKVTSNSGLVIIGSNDLTINADDETEFIGSQEFTNSNYVVNGGTYTGTCIQIYSTKFTLNDGTINLKTMDMRTYEDNEFIVNGGTINVESFIYCFTSDYYTHPHATQYNKIDINGGKVNAGVYYCTVTMRDGEFAASKTGNNNHGIDLYMYGGKVTGQGTGQTFFASYIEMYGGEMNVPSARAIMAESTAIIYGGKIYGDIPIRTSKVTIYDGEIHGIKYALSENGQVNIYGGKLIGDLYGIYRNYDVTIGENEENGIPSKTSPVIIGDTYALYGTGGTVNIYDGLFKGKTAPIYNTGINGPAGYNFNSNDIEEIPDSDDVYYLGYLVRPKLFLQVGNNKYSSFSDLFEAETANNLTIDVIDDTNDSVITEKIEFPEGKNVTLNLNGHIINTLNEIVFKGDTVINDTKVTEGNEEVYKGTIYASKMTFNTVEINGGNYYSPIKCNNSSEINDANIFDKVEANLSGNSSLDIYTSKINVISGTGNVVIHSGEINRISCFRQSCNVTLEDGNIISNSEETVYHAKITINGGRIENTSQDGFAFEYSTVILNAGTIKAANGFKYGGSTDSIINGGVIEVTNDAFYNPQNVVILNGTIKAPRYGIYMDESSSSITIGADDANTPIRNNPVIIADDTAIYKTNGRVSFYDGTIKGKENAIVGFATGLPDGYVIKDSDTEEISGETYHVGYLDISSDFLQVGSNTYNSINKIFDENNSDNIVIDVIDNGILSSTQTIPAGKTVTLNLNESTITSLGKIVNNGTLTINSSMENDEYKGTVLLNDLTFIENYGQLNIMGGNYNLSTIDNVAFIVGKSGNINFEKGIISFLGSTMRDSGNVIKLESSASLNIKTDAKIYVKNQTAILCSNANSITMNGGYLETDDIAYDGCILNMQNGTIKGSDSSLFTIKNSTINISNGSIINNNRYGGAINNSNVTMTGGEITCAGDGIYNYSGNKTINISGGTIDSTEYGVYLRNGQATILGGNIKGDVYGIYQYSGTTLTIGENEENGVPSKTNPVIKGGTYGVYSRGGTFNFYDGIIKGKTGAISGTISSLATNSTVVTNSEIINENDEDVTYEVKYLEQE